MHNNRFAVIGVGQYGRAIALRLATGGAEVMVIDSNQEVINLIAEEVAYSVVLDATDIKALVSQNITDFGAVIVAIGDFESRLLCATILMDLGVGKIIVRAVGKRQKLILEKIGISHVFCPEEEVASVLFERLLNPNVHSFLVFPDGYRIVEVSVPGTIAYQTIEEINFVERYHISLLTIINEVELIRNKKVTTEKHVLPVPNKQTVILPTDNLVLFGLAKDITKFLKVNQ